MHSFHMVIIHAPPIHAFYVIIGVVITEEILEFNAIVGLVSIMHVVWSMRKHSTTFCY